MKFHRILVIIFVFIIMGCGEKDQAIAEPTDEAPIAEAVAVTAASEFWQNDAFREHMHVHAEKLDDLNFALADGDLEAAKISANWLATHDTDSEIQSDWLPYLYGMRMEAEIVEAAPDIATAKAAAERITVQCQQCHAAVGFSAP